MENLDFLKGWGGYTTTASLIVFALLAWWKALPKLIDAIANRQSAIEERLGSLLDATTERFAIQIAAADRRHEDCMAGQRRLIERIDEQDVRLAQQSRRIMDQDEIIAGFASKFRLLQISDTREHLDMIGQAKGLA